VGYILAPAETIAAMAAIKAHTTGSVATLSQKAALAATESDDVCVAGFRKIYEERRDLLGRGLREMGLTYGEPRGGFFFWADSSATGLRALELSYLLLKHAKVLIFPGTAFGSAWTDYLRITTLQPTEVLEEAIRRMGPVMRELQAQQSV
jgi:aspartate/methionine/tyrosine aminotransferase